MRIPRWSEVILVIAVAFGLAGCGSESGRDMPSQAQGVAEVLQKQMQGEDGTLDAANSVVTTAASSSNTYAADDVDVDLSAMSQEMVYATVSDMLTNPDDYQGRVVRMEGPYYHAHYDETDTDYFYVIIKDATACCAQGMEFVWDDGPHPYPDDYPTDGTSVVATGVFETYEESGYLYPHLVDAQLQVP